MKYKLWIEIDECSDDYYQEDSYQDDCANLDYESRKVAVFDTLDAARAFRDNILYQETF